MKRASIVSGVLVLTALLFGCDIISPPGDATTAPAFQYVSTTGSDDNDGLSPTTPLRSISLAVERSAQQDAEVRVAAGLYTRGNGLPSDGLIAISISGKMGFSLTGGWDSGFTAQSGRSELEGPTEAERESTEGGLHYQLVKVDGCTDVTIGGFTLRRGYAYGAGAGIELSASDSAIENCTVESCSALATLFAPSTGGGISVTGDRDTINATVSDCAASRGGGIWVSGDSHVIRGSVTANKAERGGGVYVNDGEGIILECALTGNRAIYGGGAYVGGSGATVQGDVSGNSATGAGVIGDVGANVRGGGLYIAGSNAVVSSDVHENESSFATVALISLAPRAYGGGVYVEGAGASLSGDVWGNSVTIATLSLISIGSGVYGGGIYAEGTDLVASGEVRDNEMKILGEMSLSYGAGICLMRAHRATIRATVKDNLTSTVNVLHETKGHGVYVYGAQDVKIEGASIQRNRFSGILGKPQQIHICGCTEDPLTGLVIDGCTIEGSGESKGYAIVEGSGEQEVDITGHTMNANSFASVDNLYHDFGGTDIAADATGIAVLNTPGDAGHGATTAQGNILK